MARKKQVIDPAEPLRNIRHEKFVHGIIAGENTVEAYRAAGYTARPANARKHGYALKNRPEVAARIRHLSKQLESEAIAGAREIQELYTSIMRGEVTETRVHGGVPEKFELKPQIDSRIRAADNLARMKGLDKPTPETGGDGQLTAIITALGWKTDKPREEE